MNNIIKTQYHTYQLVWADRQTTYFQLKTTGERADVTIGGDNQYHFDQGYYAVINEEGSVMETFDNYDEARKEFDSSHDFFQEADEKHTN